MNTMTLLQLRTAVRQRSDMENASGVYTNSFIKDPELNSYINQSYFEFYDILMQKYGENYFIKDPYEFTADGTTELFSLPNDFYKLIGLSVKIFGSVTNYLPLRQASVTEMQRYSGINNQSVIGLNKLIYHLSGSKVWIVPTPQSGQVIRMLYAPILTPLAVDSDTVDGISGWTEYIIIDAAIKCLQKEESDTGVLERQKAAMLKRIEEASSNRDAASPSKVSDTDRGYETNDFGFFRGGLL